MGTWENLINKTACQNCVENIFIQKDQYQTTDGSEKWFIFLICKNDGSYELNFYFLHHLSFMRVDVNLRNKKNVFCV